LKLRLALWTQAYDFGIYRYNASGVVGYIERYFIPTVWKKHFYTT
jgi:hypothetical protein